MTLSAGNGNDAPLTDGRQSNAKTHGGSMNSGVNGLTDAFISNPHLLIKTNTSLRDASVVF